MKPKGILKNAHAPSTPAQDSAAAEVVWDEANLETNLAERPEGGYMKIDEPKTPFYVREGDEGAGEEAGNDEGEEMDPEVEERLEAAKTQMEKVAKTQDFAAKRKMHYKTEEGDVLRKVREKKTVHKQTTESSE